MCSRVHSNQVDIFSHILNAIKIGGIVNKPKFGGADSIANNSKFGGGRFNGQQTEIR
jgi:hypothetical protein